MTGLGGPLSSSCDLWLGPSLAVDMEKNEKKKGIFEAQWVTITIQAAVGVQSTIYSRKPMKQGGISKDSFYIHLHKK